MSLTLLLLTMILPLIKSDCGGEFKIMCYFSSWTGIHPEAKNCTHIVYTFARIEDDNTLTGQFVEVRIESICSFLRCME
jgi:GH18 family chitinase